MPFGLDLAHWDENKLADVEISSFLQQVAVMNTATKHALCLGVHWSDTGRVKDLMEAGGYKDIRPLYNYKPQQNQSGMGFIFATEIWLLGYKPGARDVVHNFPDPHPMMRHNLFYGHQVRSQWRTLAGNVVNVTQKHPEFAFRLARILCPAGSHALIVGAGSGSEIIGIAQAGISVLAFENDEVQFTACCARLTAVSASLEAAQEELEGDVAQSRRLVCTAMRFPSLRDSVDSQAFEDLDVEDDDAIKEDESAVKTCPACGQQLLESEELETCLRKECNVILHVQCGVNSEENGFMCC